MVLPTPCSPTPMHSLPLPGEGVHRCWGAGGRQHHCGQLLSGASTSQTSGAQYLASSDAFIRPRAGSTKPHLCHVHQPQEHNASPLSDSSGTQGTRSTILHLCQVHLPQWSQVQNTSLLSRASTTQRPCAQLLTFVRCIWYTVTMCTITPLCQVRLSFTSARCIWHKEARFTIPHLHQVHLPYRARCTLPHLCQGQQSSGSVRGTNSTIITGVV
jgi:hypothetical protein